ncbi:MAG: DNA repair protein RecO [Chloroflexi bacterium CG08_land_8_20_14_0_20_45_12]|nr:MAG: DNA repair protein RecO [Chloroflexi bacterium CG08_land_8_20_14_0_20_45_12]
MSSPRNYQTQAIILKQIKLGEFDKLLAIYTPEFGKLQALAKGACRPGSKLGGNVEPLTHSLLFLARGRKLDIITQSQTIDGFLGLKSDLWRLSYGFYILELIDLFTMENSVNRPLFDLLLETLHRLNEADNDQIILRYFEFNLLCHLGYRPQLKRCVICNSYLKAQANSFSCRQGGVLCPLCAQKETAAHPLSVDALKVLRLWESCDYTMAVRVKLKPELSWELRQVLQDYIKYHLQQEVKSMRWLEELKKLSLVDSNSSRH